MELILAPLPANLDRKPPARPSGQRQSSNSSNHLTRLLGDLDRLGVKVPKAVTAAHDRYRQIAATSTALPSKAPERAVVAARIGSGAVGLDALDELPFDEAKAERLARSKAHSAARAAAWDDAFVATQAAAPKLFGPLNDALARVIAEQGRSRYTDAGLAQEYQCIHSAGATLRMYLGDLTDPVHPDWFRFAEPHAVAAWRAAHYLGLSMKYREPKIYTQDLGAGVLQAHVTGVEPTLADIAHHANEWKPTVRSTHEVIEHVTASLSAPTTHAAAVPEATGRPDIAR